MPEAFSVEVVLLPGETVAQGRVRLDAEIAAQAKARGADTFTVTDVRERIEQRPQTVLRAQVSAGIGAQADGPPKAPPPLKRADMPAPGA